MSESEWLKYRAKQTGKTVDEIREIMAERGRKSDKSKTSFANLTPKELKKLSLKGVEARRRKKQS